LEEVLAVNGAGTFPVPIRDDLNGMELQRRIQFFQCKTQIIIDAVECVFQVLAPEPNVLTGLQALAR
jgi:hypothetical protein